MRKSFTLSVEVDEIGPAASLKYDDRLFTDAEMLRHFAAALNALNIAIQEVADHIETQKWNRTEN